MSSDFFVTYLSDRSAPMTRKDEKAACCPLYPRAHAWMLTNIKRIEPIPVKGSLGIFDCPIEPEDLTYIER